MSQVQASSLVTTRAAGLERLAGKYMTFRLAEENYGLAIQKVREIIGLMEITRVPRAQPCVRGVVNLRGKVIPVVDLRLKFGLPSGEATEQTVIIVVQCQVGGQSLTMGLYVDQVLEVRSVEAADIEPAPDLGRHDPDHAFLLGVGKHDAQVIFLLDIDAVLAADGTTAAAA